MGPPPLAAPLRRILECEFHSRTIAAKQSINGSDGAPAACRICLDPEREESRRRAASQFEFPFSTRAGSSATRARTTGLGRLQKV